MDLNKPQSSLNDEEKENAEVNLTKAKRYGNPRKVWVEDGHVFVEGHDGDLISMTPKVAIAMGRLLSDAGTDSLVNQVMNDVEGTSE